MTLVKEHILDPLIKVNNYDCYFISMQNRYNKKDDMHWKIWKRAFFKNEIGKGWKEDNDNMLRCCSADVQQCFQNFIYINMNDDNFFENLPKKPTFQSWNGMNYPEVNFRRFDVIRKLTHNEEVRGLQVISHLIGIPAIVYAIYMGWWGYLATAWLTYWVIGTLGINVAFHRLISQRSYKTSKFWEYLFAFIGIYTTVGRPAWVALHREHHKHAETEKGSHLSYVIGWWRAWFGWWNIQRINPRTIKDIRKEKFYTLTHKYYTHILVASIIIMALFDPWVVYLWAVPLVMSTQY